MKRYIQSRKNIAIVAEKKFCNQARGSSTFPDSLAIYSFSMEMACHI
jgi:hypothetical protein